MTYCRDDKMFPELLGMMITCAISAVRWIGAGFLLGFGYCIALLLFLWAFDKI